MKCFDYPIDTKYLYRKKSKIEKELRNKKGLMPKKIAILGGSTTDQVVGMLNIFLLNNGIEPLFYQSEFGQFWQDAMFGTEKLDNFAPDIIYIHTSWRNIERFPSVADGQDDVAQLLNAEVSRFEMMWDKLAAKFHCPIIQNNFDRPNYRLMGNRDIWDYRGKSNFIFNLNQRFYQYAQTHEDFYINDIDYLAQEYGLSQWNDSLYWHMYKLAMCMNAVPFVAQSVANIIKSIYGKNKKLLALDLDNTLWGGVIGDDGVEGIKIGPEIPQGQAFSEFQQYCKDLKDIGVILAVNSKNEEDNARLGLNHPSGILKPDDFVSIKANWNPKDQNLKEIAEELGIGTDSFVFVDDNPAEQEIVNMQMPEVSVPHVERVDDFIKYLDHSGYYEVTTYSSEDLHKTELYHAKAEAKKTEKMFDDYGQYLQSLQMKAVITDFEPLSVQRVAQLTNKSNQFNLTTLRCSEDDIQKMQNDSRYLCLSGRLVDKFADNGIVSVVSGEQIEDTLHLRLWLMSCRVLKRGMEDVMMNYLVQEAKGRGVKEIIGYYYPTAKNKMVSGFYKTMGFDKYSEDDGNTVWVLNIEDYLEKKVFIQVD